MDKNSFDILDKQLSELNKRVNINFDINAVSNEVAMGLTQGLIDLYSELTKQLVLKFSSNIDRCYQLINSGQAHWFEKVVAGNIISFHGDKRVPPFPELIKIEGGQGWFGTRAEEVDDIFEKYKRFGVKKNWIEKECPQYSTFIPSFSISRFPVTNSQYKEFLLETGYANLPTSWSYGRYPFERANHPVYTVTLEDANHYCNWLSGKLQANIFLPSEEQWEFAANKGEQKQFTWGNAECVGLINTNELLLQSTSPVGVFNGSDTADGISDMLGNVEELTSTKYAPYENGKLIQDDLWLKLGAYNILKGGAFNRFFDLARIQRRHGPYPSSLYAVGFRVCA